MKKILLTAILCTSSIFSQEIGQNYSLSINQLASGDYKNPAIKAGSAQFLNNFVATNKLSSTFLNTILTRAQEFFKKESYELYHRAGFTTYSALDVPILFLMYAKHQKAIINHNDLLKLLAILVGIGNYHLNYYPMDPEQPQYTAAQGTRDTLRLLPDDENSKAVKQQIINLGTRLYGPEFMIQYNKE